MKREQLATAADILSRLVLGGVFLYASWTKIEDPALFARSVADYQMLPSFAVSWVAILLPPMEALAGIMLIASRWSREAALTILGLLGVFFVGLTQAFIRNLDISCGCFGGDADTGRAAIAAALGRDALLLLPTIWLLRRPNGWIVNRIVAGASLAALVACGAVLLFRPHLLQGHTPGESHPSPSAAAHTNVTANMDAVLAQALAAPPLAGTDVALEKWTRNFPVALARAQATRRPLILAEGSRKCEYCRRLRQALNGKAFKAWVQGTGVYLADALLDETNKIPASAALATFLSQSPHEKALPGFPYVGVFWPKSSNDFVWTVFSGRRGEMPGKPNPSLTLELTDALDTLLADYLKSHKRKSAEDLLATSLKHIKAAAKGHGKVVMTPASGELKDNGMRLEIVAKPAKGFVFKEWRGPDGKRIRPEGPFPIPRLSLPFTSREGTYTAVFKKK